MRRRARTDEDILQAMAAEPDGLDVRHIGVWSLRKLALLLMYFEGFTRACARAGGGYYVDGLAGPGMCRIRGATGTPEYVWGSPLLGLRTDPPFAQCLFVELSPPRARALDLRAKQFGGRAVVHQGDVNHTLVDIVREQVPAWAPCFCLLDPEGTELHWSTVSGLASVPRKRNKPEMLILLPLEMGILRLLTTSDVLSAGAEDAINRVFPNRGWWPVYRDRLTRRITPAQAKEQYLQIYCDGLRTLGYTYVEDVEVSAPTSPGGRRRKHYHLVFASDSETGERIMRYVMRRPLDMDFPVTGQPRLL